MVENYLASRHYCLWSVWNTKTDLRQRREAAEWFMQELANIIEHAKEQDVRSECSS